MEVYKICPRCSHDMYFDDFDNLWRCSNCVTELEGTGDDYDGVYGEDEVPMGCKVCGNFANYPDCMLGCPAYDD